MTTPRSVLSEESKALPADKGPKDPSDPYDQGPAEFWRYFKDKNSRPVPAGRYKLHISINPAEYEMAKAKIHPLLIKAFEDKLIRTYKRFVVSDASPNVSMQMRQSNAPFCIYLLDHYNDKYLEEIATLCRNIEDVLHEFKIGDPDKRSKADLTLSSHIIFRQAVFDEKEYSTKNYVSALADDKSVEQLVKESTASYPYTELSKYMREPRKEALVNSTLSPEEAKLSKELESAIQEGKHAVIIEKLTKAFENNTNFKISLFDFDLLRMDKRDRKNIIPNSLFNQLKKKIVDELTVNFSENLKKELAHGNLEEVNLMLLYASEQAIPFELSFDDFKKLEKYPNRIDERALEKAEKPVFERLARGFSLLKIPDEEKAEKVKFLLSHINTASDLDIFPKNQLPLVLQYAFDHNIKFRLSLPIYNISREDKENVGEALYKNLDDKIKKEHTFIPFMRAIGRGIENRQFNEVNEQLAFALRINLPIPIHLVDELLVNEGVRNQAALLESLKMYKKLMPEDISKEFSIQLDNILNAGGFREANRMLRYAFEHKIDFSLSMENFNYILDHERYFDNPVYYGLKNKMYDDFHENLATALKEDNFNEIILLLDYAFDKDIDFKFSIVDSNMLHENLDKIINEDKDVIYSKLTTKIQNDFGNNLVLNNLHAKHYDRINNYDDRQKFVSGLLDKSKSERREVLASQDTTDLNHLKKTILRQIKKTELENPQYETLLRDINKQLAHLELNQLMKVLSEHTHNNEKKILITHLITLFEKSTSANDIEQCFKLLIKVCLQNTSTFASTLGSELTKQINKPEFQHLKQLFLPDEPTKHQDLQDFAIELDNKKHFSSSNYVANFEAIIQEIHQLYSNKLVEYAQKTALLLTSLISQESALDPFKYPGFNTRSQNLIQYKQDQLGDLTQLENKGHNLSEAQQECSKWAHRYVELKAETTLVDHIRYVKSLYEILTSLSIDKQSIKMQEEALGKEMEGLTVKMSPRIVDAMTTRLIEKIIPTLLANIQQLRTPSKELEVKIYVKPLPANPSTSADIIYRLASEVKNNPILQSTPTPHTTVVAPAPTAAVLTPTVTAPTPADDDQAAPALKHRR